MSIATVQNAFLSMAQKNPGLDAEFSTPLTGTATSSGEVVTGAGTLFASEVRVGDYIGNPVSGYRKVVAITDDTHLSVSSGFDTPLNGEIKITQIRKGLPKTLNLTETGRTLRIAFSSAAESDENCPNTQVRAIYGFIVVIGFYEPDDDEAEARKSLYDKLIKNLIDQDPTLGGTVLGTTDSGQIKFAESPDVDGVYFGIMPLVCERKEVRGNR